MRKLLFSSMIIFLGCNLLGQDISFYKENITMKIGKDTFYVCGTYYLKSDSSRKGTIIYPFPEDPKYGKVDSVYIHNLTTHETIIPLKTTSGYLVFKIDFNQYHNLEIQIAYRQELLSTRAEYILKTTRYWQKPLRYATYQLIVPSTIQVRSFSILPQDSIFTDTETVYYWEKDNYMPEENFIFDFMYK